MFSILYCAPGGGFKNSIGKYKEFEHAIFHCNFSKANNVPSILRKKKEIICAIILIDSRCQSCPSLSVKKTSHKWEYSSILGEHGECWFKVSRLESVKWIKSKSPKVRRRCQKPRRVKVTRNCTNLVRISKWRATPLRTFKMTLDTVTALIHRWIDQMEKKTRWSKHLSDSLLRLHLVLLLSVKRCSKIRILKRNFNDESFIKAYLLPRFKFRPLMDEKRKWEKICPDLKN